MFIFVGECWLVSIMYIRLYLQKRVSLTVIYNNCNNKHNNRYCVNAIILGGGMSLLTCSSPDAYLNWLFNCG